MICNNCMNRKICTIYHDVISNLSSIEIAITSCKFASVDISNIPSVSNNAKEISENNYEPKRGINYENESIIEASKKNTLKQLENKKEQEKNKPKLNTKFTAEPLALDYICPTCGGHTFKEDVAHCDVCNKIVCSCCATVDSNTGNLLCQECWLKC